MFSKSGLNVSLHLIEAIFKVKEPLLYRDQNFTLFRSKESTKSIEFDFYLHVNVILTLTTTLVIVTIHHLSSLCKAWMLILKCGLLKKVKGTWRLLNFSLIYRVKDSSSWWSSNLFFINHLLLWLMIDHSTWICSFYKIVMDSRIKIPWTISLNCYIIKKDGFILKLTWLNACLKFIIESRWIIRENAHTT